MNEINKQLVDNIQKNNIDEVIKLLNKGADVNYNNGRPLCYGIDTKDCRMIKLLLDRGAIMYGVVLCNACDTNNSEIVELLLKEGINYNGIPDTLINICIFNDDSNSLSLLIQYDIVQITINQKIFFREINKYMTIWNICLKKKKKNMLEFIMNNHPEIIPKIINKSYIKRKDIQKYNFVKMLINRNLIDIPN
jgi:hypothetical protein